MSFLLLCFLTCKVQNGRVLSRYVANDVTRPESRVPVLLGKVSGTPEILKGLFDLLCPDSNQDGAQGVCLSHECLTRLETWGMSPRVGIKRTSL